MINKRIRTLLVHCCFLTIYIANEVNAALHIGSGTGFWDFALFFTADITLFYTLSYGVLPFFAKGRWFSFAGVPLVAACWAAFLWAYNVLNEVLNHIYATRDPIHFETPNYYWHFYRAVYITIVALLLYIGRRNVAHIKEKMRLRNLLLQSQLNPHFLFNNLSAIYNLIDHDPAKAKQAVISFSGILHYNLRDIKGDGNTPLRDEMEQIERYLQIERLHKPELNIVFEKDVPDSLEMNVPTLLLVTLVENMFKHGWLADPEYPAIIRASSNGKTFHFHTGNEIRADADTRGYHIGLDNSRARLQALYRGKYTLSTSVTGDRFILDLIIDL